MTVCGRLENEWHFAGGALGEVLLAGCKWLGQHSISTSIVMLDA